MLRPSISTSSLLAVVVLKPRALIAQVLPSDWATWRPVAIRRASGRLLAPERRTSSPVITVIAAAAPETGSLRRETEVTSSSMSCSMLRLFSSEDWAAGASWSGYAGPAAARVAHRAATAAPRA